MCNTSDAKRKVRPIKNNNKNSQTISPSRVYAQKLLLAKYLGFPTPIPMKNSEMRIQLKPKAKNNGFKFFSFSSLIKLSNSLFIMLFNTRIQSCMRRHLFCGNKNERRLNVRCNDLLAVCCSELAVVILPLATRRYFFCRIPMLDDH